MALSFAPIAIGALIALTAATSSAKANWGELFETDPMTDEIITNVALASEEQSFTLISVCWGEAKGDLVLAINTSSAWETEPSDWVEYRVDSGEVKKIKLVSDGMAVMHTGGDMDAAVVFAKEVSSGSRLALKLNGVADTFDMSEADPRLGRFLAGCPKVEPMAYGPQQPTGN